MLYLKEGDLYKNVRMLTETVKSPFYGDIYILIRGEKADTWTLAAYYEENNIIPPHSSNYISDISYDVTHPHLMFPTAVGSPNPSGDACWSSVSMFGCVAAGGGFLTGLSDGLFAFVVNSAVDVAGTDRGVCAIE